MKYRDAVARWGQEMCDWYGNGDVVSWNSPSAKPARAEHWYPPKASPRREIPNVKPFYRGSYSIPNLNFTTIWHWKPVGLTLKADETSLKKKSLSSSQHLVAVLVFTKKQPTYGGWEPQQNLKKARSDGGNRTLGAKYHTERLVPQNVLQRQGTTRNCHAYRAMEDGSLKVITYGYWSPEAIKNSRCCMALKRQIEVRMKWSRHESAETRCYYNQWYGVVTDYPWKPAGHQREAELILSMVGWSIPL